MAFKVEFKGEEEMTRKLKAFAQKFPKKVAAILFKEANFIMTTSKGLVPVDLGTLKSTGHVSLPLITKSSIEVTLAYGGPAAPYALDQHENLSYQHKGHGQPKYLQYPMEAAAATILKKIGSKVKI